jgi:chorismate mutase
MTSPSPPDPGASSAAPTSLAELRREIDRIDEAMHRLLMERGEIIDRLNAVKRTQESGSAFRPGREAAMMREIVGRHRGILPVDIVESIWRVIIATFTHLQAPYTVHGDTALGAAAMRDVARFHFGFVVPYETHDDAADVIHAVASSRGDLGLVPSAAPGAWWRALEQAGAPKIIARLPFVERADHPAALPTYVVSKPVDEAAAVNDVRLFSVLLPDPATAAPAKGAASEASVVARAGAALLLAVAEGETATSLSASLPAGTVLVPVGSHAAPCALETS